MRGILNEGCYILGVMKITLITPHLWMWKMSFFGRDISRGRGGGPSAIVECSESLFSGGYIILQV